MICRVKQNDLPTPSTIGERLRYTRQGYGFKQIDLAEAMGVAQDRVSRIENGRSKLISHEFQALKRLMPEMDLNWLIVNGGE